jgi:hypothetical protein
LGYYELDSSASGQGQVAGSCEHGNKPSCSIKCSEILADSHETLRSTEFASYLLNSKDASNSKFVPIKREYRGNFKMARREVARGGPTTGRVSLSSLMRWLLQRYCQR